MTQRIFLGYIRKSVVDDETTSPARQKATIERKLASAYPDAIIEWFQDLDISGRYEASRPGWQALLKRLDDPQVAGVCLESIDRGHRNLVEFLRFFDNVLSPLGKTLISATQDIDMGSAQGRALASLLMTFSELESRIASERMTGTLKHLRTQGRFHGGTPFACDRHPQTKHLVPSEKAYLYNPATGEALPDTDPPPPGFERRYYHDALRCLFETYAAGQYSLFDLALYLNAAGWRFWSRDCRTPTEFQRYTTQSIICRWEIYAGRIPATSGNKRTSGIHRPVTMQAGHAPILPVELCEKAGAVLRARVGSGGPKPAGFFLAGGVVYCGGCGVKLSGYTDRSRGTTRRYYRHGEGKEKCPERRARADDIHTEITGMVDELLGGGLVEVVATLRRIGAELAAGAGGGEAEEKRAEMERLISLHVKGLITEEEFTRHRAALQAEIERLRPAFYGQPVAEVEATIANLEGLLAGFTEDDPILQKETVRGLFERIELQDRRVSRVVLQPWLADLFAVVGRLDLGQGVSWRLLELLA